MNNIILIGMPGVGKSTIGVVLAKVLGYEFVDSDLIIQKREGKRLFEIMEERGMDGFISIENEVNASLDYDNTIIATGGSAIYGEKAMKHLREIGTVVYLKVSYNTIKKRLRNLQERGVVLKKGQTLKDLYTERSPLYEKYADITIHVDHLSIPKTIDKMIEKMKDSTILNL